MGADFSVKSNDAKAKAVADKLIQKFPPGTISADSLSNLCAFLYEYAGLDYMESMTILNRLNISEGNPADMLRLAYALIHYTKPSSTYVTKAKFIAHAKIVSVTADKIGSKNPQICIRSLLVSSPYAGKLIDYALSLRDAVNLHKKIYSGRSKVLAGRSLLEFVGALCTVHVLNDSVQYIDADKEEKKLNKELCADRAKADTECVKAPVCSLCKERRSTCRLAVRY